MKDRIMNHIHLSFQLQQVPKYQSLLGSALPDDVFDDCSWEYYHAIVHILEQLDKSPCSSGGWDILEDLG